MSKLPPTLDRWQYIRICYVQVVIGHQQGDRHGRGADPLLEPNDQLFWLLGARKCSTEAHCLAMSSVFLVASGLLVFGILF